MSYIGRDIRTGAFRQLDDISSGFDGSDTTHTMQVNSTNVSVGDVNQILLSLGGVIQKPGTDFTVSGSTLTFTTAPAANTSFFAVLLGSDNGGTVTPTDGSVTPGKTSFFNGTSLSVADLGIGLHLKESDSGSSSVDAHANQLVIEHGTSGEGCGISFLAATDGFIRLAFGDSGDDNIGQIVYNNTGNSMSLITNTATAVSIDDDGQVTMPKQPAFNLISGSTLTISANSNTNVTFGTERFDTNGNFASNIFTAPVNGKYQLSSALYIMDIDTDMNYVQMEIATSNRTYYTAFSTAGFDATMQYGNLTQAVVADMDANDTAVVRIYYNAGSSLRLDGSSYFSGALLA